MVSLCLGGVKILHSVVKIKILNLNCWAEWVFLEFWRYHQLIIAFMMAWFTLYIIGVAPVMEIGPDISGAHVFELIFVGGFLQHLPLRIDFGAHVLVYLSDIKLELTQKG